MYKSLLLSVLLFLTVCQLNSQDFEISFDGRGAVIDSVRATNLSTGESILLPGDATLILRNITSGINTFQYEKGRLTVLYPPDENEVIINFSPISSQKISVQLYDISGRLLAKKGFTISKGINQFTISAKQRGVYFLNILAGDNSYNTKVMIKGQSNNNIRFLSYSDFKNSNNPLKNIGGDPYVMSFSEGDIISYELHSGISTTIINAKASTSAILSTDFHECVDYESNSYSVVAIGGRWWMAENLKSTRYSDGTELPILEETSIWIHLPNNYKAYCFYNNDESLDYGVLYTHSAAADHPDTDKNRQGICPDGWDLPTDDEWMEMENYLIDNGYNWDETTSGNKIGKSLASTSGWINSNHVVGAVGNIQSTNNSTGFNAMPAGFRSNTTGEFLDEGFSGNWWSRTKHPDSTANKWYLRSNNSSLSHELNLNNSTFYSVRCIRFSSLIKANFIADKTDVSVGETVTFTDLSSGVPKSWRWNFGDCNTSAEQNPSHIYTSPGTYSVRIEVDQGSSFGMIETKTDYIIVSESEKNTVSDTEGNHYKTIKIGRQWWMAENLKSTRYADGTEVPHVTDDTEWGSLTADNTSKAYCFYNNDESSWYGILYTYAAAVNGIPYDGSADVQGICPDGWHIPVEDEWTELENYLIANGFNYDGSILGNKISKSLASTSGWTESTNEGAVGSYQNTNNKSGFNGPPGGYRSYYTTTGEFAGAGDGGYWWMATELFDESAMYWNLFYNYKHVLRDYASKRTGLSVRCIKNDDGSPTADFIADTTEVKLGGTVNFTDLSTNDPNKWIWNFGVCGETSSEQNPSYRFTSEGIHRITLIAYNDNGYDAESKEAYINVIQRTGLVNDIEGNIYRTVEIGNQWWMAENLKTTKFKDGTDIPLVTNDSLWGDISTPAYGWYDADQTLYGDTYGALYNWYSVNTGKLCPSDWHVPTDNDWKELESALGMLPEDIELTRHRGAYIGSKLAGNADLWRTEEMDSMFIESNVFFGTSGFSALPGGSNRSYHDGNSTDPEGEQGIWWSSTEFNSDEVWYRLLGGTKNTVFRNHIVKKNGFSVRCVQD